MALRRAALQRARKEREQRGELEPADQAGSDDIRLVRVSLNVSKIVRKLQGEAEKGSTAAAKELRAWMSEVKPEHLTGVDDLDRRTRQRMLVRLIAEDEAALPSRALVSDVEGDEHVQGTGAVPTDGA